MSLTGLSLEIYIFHFEAISLSLYLRFQATDLHKLGLVGKVLARRWFLAYDPKKGLWSAAD
jgi:hypothetical protein